MNDELHEAMVRRGLYRTEYEAVRAARKFGTYFPVPYRGGFVLL